MLLSSLLGATCYSGPVNMRPTLTIKGPTDFPKGGPVRVTATPADPDGQRVTVSWLTQANACEDLNAILARRGWEEGDWSKRPPGFSLDLGVADRALTSQNFCVWAKAVDAYGATALDVFNGVPENHAPVAFVEITDHPAATSFPLHTHLQFTTASSTDFDKDMLTTIKWTIENDDMTGAVPVFDGSCPDGPAPADMHLQCWTASFPGSFVVRATVSDGSPLTAVAERRFGIQAGQAPVAKLRLVSPSTAVTYKLGTEFHVSADRSTDPDDSADTLMFDWDSTDFTKGAPSSVATLGDCQGMFSPSERCFRADVKGLYVVKVRVSDRANNIGEAELPPFEVSDDQPPCLGLTNPPLTQVSVAGLPGPGTMTFSVDSVDDDLDPYPASASGDPLHDRTTFRWFLSEEGGPFKRVSDFPSLMLPTDLYLSGDQIKVRVEVLDRNTDRSNLLLNNCTADVCPTMGTCFQRMTWKVDFKL